METHSIIQHCKCCEKCDKYCQIQCQLPLNPYKMQNPGNRLSFSKCLAALTFTFAASALGSVGHCSGVWASVQDQQLLWHSVVITARQRGVWRYRQEDREMIFTVSCGNVRIKLPARGTREGECEKERIREVAGMRLTETDSDFSTENQYLLLMTQTVLLLVTIASQETCFQQLPQRKTSNYSEAATELLSVSPSLTLQPALLDMHVTL